MVHAMLRLPCPDVNFLLAGAFGSSPPGAPALTVLLGSPGLCPAAEFQLAFSTRLQSVRSSRDASVLLKRGWAESLQAEVPGVFIGRYRERVLLTDPETDPANGLFKIRETLATPLGRLDWEAVVWIVDSGTPFYGALGWSRGTITGGSGLFAGATGSVEITGRNTSCDPAAEEFCVPSEDDPSVGQRQDFHVVLRGEVADPSRGGPPGRRGGSGPPTRRNR
jgi:hypothetical protein